MKSGGRPRSPTIGARLVVLTAIVLATGGCGAGAPPPSVSMVPRPTAASPEASTAAEGGTGSETPPNGVGGGAPETPSPFSRHDTPPGTVASFLDFTTGGGGLCDDTIEDVEPSVDFVPVIPMVVCAYGFTPELAVDLVVHGPNGWSWHEEQVANVLGGAFAEINDLPVPIRGEYVVKATQGQISIEEPQTVAFDSLIAGILPSGISIGQTARLVVAGGPPGSGVPAYLYRQDQERQGHVFIADLGIIALDANGEGAMEITPRQGDAVGDYMIDVRWPPGSESQEGPRFSIEGVAGDDVDYISNGIRPEIDGCNRREADLPPGAIAAVECRPDSDLVHSVGFYLFGSEADMDAAYSDRLASSGIARDSGDCAAGQPGDRAWGDTDSDRIGCFLNSQGFANLRWTVAVGPIYIGVLGESDDIGALMDWSSASPLGTNLWVRP